MESTDILTVEELKSKYPYHWAAVKVIEREKEAGQPLRVKVITANADIYSSRIGLKQGEYCILYTGSVPEEQYVLMY